MLNEFLHVYQYNYNSNHVIIIYSVFQYVEIDEEDLDSKDGLIAVEAARISQFYNLLTSSIDVIFKFCDKIPGFNDLCKEDRELLFRSACLELFTLRLSHRFIVLSFFLCNNNHLSPQDPPTQLEAHLLQRNCPPPAAGQLHLRRLDGGHHGALQVTTSH